MRISGTYATGARPVCARTNASASCRRTPVTVTLRRYRSIGAGQPQPLRGLDLVERDVTVQAPLLLVERPDPQPRRPGRADLVGRPGGPGGPLVRLQERGRLRD